MTLLISLDAAKAHLNMDHDADDDLIETYISAASEAVIDYIGDASLTFVDSTGILTVDEEDVPARVQQAVKILVTYFYTNRAGDPAQHIDQKFGYGYLPLAVTALLYPLRIPPV